MVKIFAVLALIAILAGGFFYLNRGRGKTSPGQQTATTATETVTSQNIDSTLNEQATTIDSTMTQVDQDFKEIDQTDQSESDLQGI